MTPHSREHFWPNRARTELSGLLDDDSRFAQAWADDDVFLDDLLDRCSPYSPAGQVDLSEKTSVYLPENYEPNYAYPLIIWLDGEEPADGELLQLMPTLSTRNYLATTVSSLGRDERAAVGGALDTVSDSLLTSIENDIRETVREIRSEYHVHSERIFLAGCGHQGTRALQLALRHPEWFGGVAAFGGRVPKLGQPLAGFHHLHGKRVLLGMRSRDGRFSLAQAVRAARLLHSAGLNVGVRVYDAADQITPKMLSDMDHWIMEGICESNLV